MPVVLVLVLVCGWLLYKEIDRMGLYPRNEIWTVSMTVRKILKEGTSIINENKKLTSLIRIFKYGGYYLTTVWCIYVALFIAFIVYARVLGFRD